MPGEIKLVRFSLVSLSRAFARALCTRCCVCACLSLRCSRAALQLHASSFDEALRCAKDAIELKRDEPYAYSIIAQFYFERSDFKNGLQFLKKSCELQPSNANALEIYAEYCAHHGEVCPSDEAIEAYHKLISLQPSNYRAHGELARWRVA
jgi:tetratricopeptide (TPR) repeat protein